jgi:sterol desaturase/sphingolipid hydroxylase (fatty acid hydroxylase superfamily)
VDGSRAAVPLIVAGLIPLTFVALLLVERWFPARELARVEGWTKKGLVFFFVTGGVQTFVPALVTLGIYRITPLHFATLGLAPCVALLLVACEALSYAIHRAMHSLPWLWRWTHQLHHSAERVDVSGSVYFHPLDVAVQSVITALPAAVFGVSPAAAAIAGYVFFFIAVFQHVNVRTPRWLGFVFLRPEQHAMHHERGVHRDNYGNFAFMDLLFRTWKNPAGFITAAGFYDGASARLREMLCGKDVSVHPNQ